MFSDRSACFLALCCAVFVSAPFTSNAGEISETIFLVEASAAGASDTFAVPLSSGSFVGDTLSWDLDEPVQLQSNGVEIGVLQQASVRYIADPVVVLSFVVSSGGAAANFTVTSANLSFAGLPNAIGRAQAGVSLTDFGGDGGLITGNFPNNEVYRAFYNDVASVPATGTAFATLTSGVSTSAFSGAAPSGAFPDNTGGFSSTSESGASLGTVASMSAQWTFSVSQFDSASGTSVFVMVPEPGSMVISLLGFVFLGLVCRRWGSKHVE